MQAVSLTERLASANDKILEIKNNIKNNINDEQFYKADCATVIRCTHTGCKVGCGGGVS